MIYIQALRNSDCLWFVCSFNFCKCSADIITFLLFCYGFKKQSLTTADFVLWNREMSCIWFLIGCGFLPKLGRSWSGEITLTVVMDRDMK